MVVSCLHVLSHLLFRQFPLPVSYAGPAGEVVREFRTVALLGFYRIEGFGLSTDLLGRCPTVCPELVRNRRCVRPLGVPLRRREVHGRFENDRAADRGERDFVLTVVLLVVLVRRALTLRRNEDAGGVFDANEIRMIGLLEAVGGVRDANQMRGFNRELSRFPRDALRRLRAFVFPLDTIRLYCSNFLRWFRIVR